MTTRHGSVQNDLVEVSTSELRLLPPSARRTLLVLLNEQARSAHSDGWVNLPMMEIARRIRASYETARKAWRFIRHIGIGVAQRHVITRYVPTSKAERELIGSKGTKKVNAYEENWFNILGSIRRGVIMLTSKAWRAFVSLAPQTNRSGLPKTHAEPPAWGLSFQSDPSESLPKPDDSYRSIVREEDLIILDRESKIAAARDFLTRPDEETPEPCGASIDQLLGTDDVVIVRPTPKPGRAPSRPLDPPLPLDHEPFQVIDAGLSEVQRAQYIVDGFRRAVRKVYGVKWFGWTKGDVTKAKGYNLIKACADVMLDKIVIPEHWAEWRLRWFKDNVKQFKSKVPPLGVIMSAKTLTKQHGFFVRDFQRPVAVTRYDQHRAEQMNRNREAWRIHQGYEGHDALIGSPKWYAEMRKVEIMFGDVDPLALYPTRGKK